jgi:hypothetical protein
MWLQGASMNKTPKVIRELKARIRVALAMHKKQPIHGHAGEQGLQTFWQLYTLRQRDGQLRSIYRSYSFASYARVAGRIEVIRQQGSLGPIREVALCQQEITEMEALEQERAMDLAERRTRTAEAILGVRLCTTR